MSEIILDNLPSNKNSPRKDVSPKDQQWSYSYKRALFRQNTQGVNSIKLIEPRIVLNKVKNLKGMSSI